MTAMEQIAQISCLAKNAGMTYGAYLAKFGSPFDAPVILSKLKKHERVCKVCGNVFEAELCPDGYHRRTGKLCPKCKEEQKQLRTKPKKRRATKIYHVKCSKCGRDITTRRPPGKGIKNYCPVCREEVTKKRKREDYKRRVQSGK